MVTRRDVLTAGAAALAVGLAESILASSEARADVPGLINYQGKLYQPSGAPIPDGTYAVTFAIYDAPVGGTALWTESYSALPVKGSMFHALLGSVNPINPSVFSGGERYLGVKVGTDAELTPRQRIASVPYAQMAESAVNGVPTGAIMPFAGAAPPPGWLLCDGSAVSRSTYANLFAALGAAYGAGDGSTSFNLPNLKGRMPVGLDAGQGEFAGLALTGGEKAHGLSTAEMPAHGHGITDPGHNHQYRPWTNLNKNFSGTGMNPLVADDPGGGTRAQFGTVPSGTGITVQSAGDSQPHNNLQPYLVVNFIIKA